MALCRRSTVTDRGEVFLTQQFAVPMPLEEADERLGRVLALDALVDATAAALADGRAILVRAGPLDGVAGKQVRVEFLPPYRREGIVIVPLRWVATGRAAALFPRLDANLELAADGPQRSRLALIGSYRPPFGSVGETLDHLVLHRAARATFQALLRHLATAMIDAPPALPAAHAGRRDPRPAAG